MAKVMHLKGNQHAKGRPRKRPTFTLKTGSGEVLLTTPDERLARHLAVGYLSSIKTVSLYDNAARRVVARWNYGHPQPLRRQ